MLTYQSLAAAALMVGGGAPIAPLDMRASERICQFGYSIECVGDLDGDGTSEFAIGTPFDSAKSPENEYGEMPIDFGGVWICSVEKSAVLAQLRGSAKGARLGECITGIGITPMAPTQCMVGEPGFEDGKGRVRVLKLPFLQVELDIEGREKHGGFGRSVALVRCGASDLRVAVTSQPIEGNGAPTAIHLIDGRTGQFISTRGYGQLEDLCRDLAIIADLNGDGISEIAVGVLSRSGPRGRIELLSGRDLEAIRVIAGEDGDLTGASVASMSLQPGLGRKLLLGCPGYNMGDERVGAVRRVDLDSDDPSTVLTAAKGKPGDQQCWGFRAGSGFGKCVTAISDITGDGEVDFAVGAPDGTYKFDSECGFIALHDGASGRFVMDCNWPLMPRDSNLYMLGFGSALKSFYVLDRGNTKAMLAVSASQRRVSLGASGVVIFDLSKPLPKDGTMNPLRAVASWQLTYEGGAFRSLRLSAQ